MSWRFSDMPSLAVITVKSVLSRQCWIATVSHDADDGGWQFLSGEQLSLDDAAVVSLQQIVEMDRSVEELADLPEGWRAWRVSPTVPWRREES
jgi:NifB/MoaA-like Fe-S oxidoreductase